MSFQIAFSDSVKSTLTKEEDKCLPVYVLFSCNLSDLCLDLNLIFSVVLFNISPNGHLVGKPLVRNRC